MKRIRAARGTGVDCSHYFDPSWYAFFKRFGVNWVARYVRRDKHVNETPDVDGWPVSLSRLELAELLEGGFNVAILQFGKFGVKPTEENGRAAGEALYHNARELEVPAGVTLWHDVEWSDKSAPPPGEAKIYIDAATRAVRDAGRACGREYSQGIYYGSNVGLDAGQLRALPRVRYYWRSMSLVPTVSGRHPVITQAWEYVLRGNKPETMRLEPFVSDGPDANGHKGKRLDVNASSIDADGSRFHLIGS